jgi:hypothetical protein
MVGGGRATAKEAPMAERKGAGASTSKPAAKKGAARPRPDKAAGESVLLAKIAAMREPFRTMGERLHTVILSSAPDLVPTLWYGMPGYAKDGTCVCFFIAEKYMTFGLTEKANLFDDGARMQPSSFALKELTAVEEERIAALVRKAVS